MPKIEKICILYIYWENLLCLQSNASDSFLQTCINFVEQKLKFSHFDPFDLYSGQLNYAVAVVSTSKQYFWVNYCGYKLNMYLSL